jgi:hypothetical protein
MNYVEGHGSITANSAKYHISITAKYHISYQHITQESQYALHS